MFSVWGGDDSLSEISCLHREYEELIVFWRYRWAQLSSKPTKKVFLAGAVLESSRSESGKTSALFAVLAGHLPLTLKAKTAHGDDEVAFTLTYVQSPHLVTLSSAATHFVKTPDWRQVLEKTRAEDVFESVSESQGPRPSAAVRVDSALCSATAHFFKLCCERMLPVAWTGSRPCWLRTGPPGNSRPLGIPQRVVQHDARDSHQSCTILCCAAWT